MTSLPMTFEWTLSDPPEEKSGLLVAFAFTRTQISSVIVRGGDSAVSLVPLKGTRFFQATVISASHTRLIVRYLGDLPRLAFLRWIVPSVPSEGEPNEPGGVSGFAIPTALGAIREAAAKIDDFDLSAILAETLDASAVQGQTVQESRVKAFTAKLSPSIEDIFKQRLRAVQWHARAQEFFLRMDVETQYEFASPRWRDQLDRTGYALGYRLLVRASIGKCGNVPQFSRLDSRHGKGKRQLEDLNAISGFMRGLILSLETLEGAALVEWAFEMFATNRLVCHHPDYDAHQWLQGHGAPDGLLFFQFGELALYCLENEVDTTLWDRYLGALVRATHAFLETALDSTVSTPTPRHSGPKRFEFHDGRFHTRERLEVLRRVKVPTSNVREFLEDRFTSLAAQCHPQFPGSTTSLEGRQLLHQAKLMPRGSRPSKQRSQPPA